MMMHAPVMIALDPIRLEAAEAVEAAGAMPLWMWIGGSIVAVAVVIAVGVGVTAGIAAYRRVRSVDPAEDAFRALCKAMRVPASEWPVVRSLAARIEAEPAAVLVSRTAFERAAGSRAASADPAVAAMRTRLFGDDAAS